MDEIGLTNYESKSCPDFFAETMVIFQTRAGHRQMYAKALRYFGPTFYVEENSLLLYLKMILTKKSLVYGTVDDHLIGFLFVSFIRSLLMKRTTGLLINPMVEVKSFSFKFKVLTLCCLKYIKTSFLVSISSHCENKLLSKVCVDKIMDPAFWDLVVSNDGLSSQSLFNIRKSYPKKDIDLLYVGTVTERKGASDFFRYSVRELTEKIDLPNRLIVAAGSVHPDFKPDQLHSFKLASGVFYEGFQSEDKILELQARASVHWALYSPSFDQSSGVLGRAWQLGGVVILRKNSLANIIARNLGVSTIAVSNMSEVSPLFEVLSVNSKLIRDDEIIQYAHASLSVIKKYIN